MKSAIGLLAPLLVLSAQPAWATGTSSAAVTLGEVHAPVAGHGLVDQFAGSVFYTQTSFNTNILAPNQQLTVDPTVETAFLLLPRYQATEWLQLRARLSLAYEWTNSDVTTQMHELQLGDAALQAFFTGIPAFLDGTKAAVGASLLLPLSKAAQAQTMIVSPSLIAEVAHGIDGVLGGTLTFKAVGAYSHPIFSNTTPGLVVDAPYQRQCFGGGLDCASQASGVANVSDALSWSLFAIGAWGPVEATLWFNMAHQFPYTFQDLPGVTREKDHTSLRNLAFFSAAVGVEITEWLGGEVSYSMTRNMLRGDGTRGNPFVDTDQDMRLNIGASIALEKFYSTVTD